MRLKRTKKTGVDVAKTERTKKLEQIIARVHDKLHQPTGDEWCDHPVSDNHLIRELRSYVEVAMGWTGGRPTKRGE